MSDVIAISLNKYFSKKIIEYPISISFGKFKYRLKGTVEHFGELNGGHYVCRVERGAPEHYIIDDTNVIPISIDIYQKSKSETYMIFYEQV